MTTAWIVTLDDPDATLAVAGGKGASLARLAQAGLPVPAAFCVSTGAYWRFVEHNALQPQILAALEGVNANKPESLARAAAQIEALFADAPVPADVAGAIEQAYAALPGQNPAVAVRSSATAEDLPQASFAGQQNTFLNVRGREELLPAVRNCWASLWTARAIGYRARQAIAPGSVALAVVVQLLVPAEAAGVLFTANPVSGRRDEILISAAWGLGEAVVAGLVTPDRILLDKATKRVKEREIGEKRVEIIPVAGGTAERPVAADRRKMPVLSKAQAAELAALARPIEAAYAMPMDIEWAWRDQQFTILQARPITALPEPAPTEWKLPEGAYAAMRNNIVELMFDPLSPLFGTMGLQAVNRSMTRLMNAFLEAPGFLPDEPIIRVNEYAYYNGSIRFGKILKLLFGSVGIARRMFGGAVERWTESGRPHYLATVQHWQAQPWPEYATPQILAAVNELTEAAIDAYGALVSGVIPAAWISEGIFSFTYRFLKRKEEPPAPVFLLGFDSLPIQAEKSLFDLASWARSEPALLPYFQDASAAQLAADFAAGQTPAGVAEAGWRQWQARFTAHLRDYGHMIYNLDYANPVPLDDPGPLLATFLMFVQGLGADPHARQQAAIERRERAVQAIEGRLRGRRLRSFHKRLERAQKYAPLREDGLADIGLAYPLLRRMLLAVGQRFTEASLIDEPADIFWLTAEEVNQAAAGRPPGENLSARIPRRKAVSRAARQAVPPLMLPQIKIFGVDMIALKGGARRQEAGSVKGVAASPGVVTAPACIVHGPEEFGKMKMGDVLVASLTTPAWTPLFARASAVVTDIGGPLSHGSIVAREYGIPAVLGTGSATRRFADGQLISVDGGAGLVRIVKDAPDGDGAL